MRFKFDPALYELADGRYIAKFIGVSEVPPEQIRNQQFPNSGPTIAWNFSFENGENHGKTGRVLTPAQLTPKNATMRMACGIMRRVIAEDEEFDTNGMNGFYYAVSVIDGYPSNKFAPQYLGKDLQTAMRTFDPDATQIDPKEPLKPDEPLPY